MDGARFYKERQPPLAKSIDQKSQFVALTRLRNHFSGTGKDSACKTKPFENYDINSQLSTQELNLQSLVRSNPPQSPAAIASPAFGLQVTRPELGHSEVESKEEKQ
jgi:hypothetical protein